MAAKLMRRSVLFKLLFLIVTNEAMEYSLEQVVILSRHHIRTPLTDGLEHYTNKEWPKWNNSVGFLTAKGAALEGYMGEYFSQWLEKENLITKDCPTENSVYIYSNWYQRTKETAREFVKTAFKGCNITVHHKENTTYDLVFHPSIQNTSDSFKAVAAKEMQKLINNIDLRRAYSILNNILDVKSSKICGEGMLCDFNEGKNQIDLKVEFEPAVIGPFKISNDVMDTFLMQFYNGMPEQDIAWGQIRDEDWKELIEITKANQRVRFQSPTIADDVAKPMTDYLSSIFLNSTRKFTLLVGHDSTITSTTARLGFKPYTLAKQHERTPVGGKVVFQKWRSGQDGRHFLKIEYVYQTFEQLRNGKELSLANPPERAVLEMLNCRVDLNGLCPWEDFVRILLEKL